MRGGGEVGATWKELQGREDKHGVPWGLGRDGWQTVVAVVMATAGRR